MFHEEAKRSRDEREDTSPNCPVVQENQVRDSPQRAIVNVATQDPVTNQSCVRLVIVFLHLPRRATVRMIRMTVVMALVIIVPVVIVVMVDVDLDFAMPVSPSPTATTGGGDQREANHQDQA